MPFLFEPEHRNSGSFVDHGMSNRSVSQPVPTRIRGCKLIPSEFCPSVYLPLSPKTCVEGRRLTLGMVVEVLSQPSGSVTVTPIYARDVIVPEVCSEEALSRENVRGINTVHPLYRRPLIARTKALVTDRIRLLPPESEVDRGFSCIHLHMTYLSSMRLFL